MRFEHAADLEKPLMTTLSEGTHYWCQCGRSENPPFCDGSHEGSDHGPLPFRSDGEQRVALCQCGLTKTPPFCDGAHRDY